MKKVFIIILAVIIGLAIIGFALKPDQEGRRVVKIGKLNIEKFDFLEMMDIVLKNEVTNSSFIIDKFTMTISNEKEIISMNLSILGQGGFAEKRITGHLMSRDNKLIIKSEILEKDRDFTIKEYISSALRMLRFKKNILARRKVFNENNFTKEELDLLISNIKQPILNSLEQQERVHVETFSKNRYHIYGDPYIYVINNDSGKIIKIQEGTENESFEIIKEDGKIKEYIVNELKSIVLSDYTDHCKYFFLEEN